MIYQVLAKKFGFTSKQVDALTPDQTSMYLNTAEDNSPGEDLNAGASKSFQRRVAEDIASHAEELVQRVFE